MRILIIEDQHRLSDVIKKGLSEEGFAVDQAFDGEEGLYLATSEVYDVIILDVMLPKIDGITLCKKVREKNVNIPILMLTARGEVEDRVNGLNSGADDYLTKPFAFAELKARIQALLRRSRHEVKSHLSIDNLVVDPLKHIVKRANKEINLTPKEFAILELLLHHKDEIVTRSQIIDHVWDYNFDSLSNIVDVFIATLRRKIDKGFDKPLIHTVHGIGYKISEKS